MLIKLVSPDVISFLIEIFFSIGQHQNRIFEWEETNWEGIDGSECNLWQKCGVE